MRRRFWMHGNLAALICIFACADAGAAKGMRTIWPSELSLGGIHHGDSKRSVVEKLGDPDSQDDVRRVKAPRLIYPGLTVWLGENGDEVVFLRSTAEKYCTPAGICPGMPFERATAAYSSIQVSKREGNKLSAYFGSPMSYKLIFEVEDGRIKAIGAGYLALFDVKPEPTTKR